MKRFWSLLFLAALAVASVCPASSCTPPPPAPTSDFAYAETSFSASVRGTFTTEGGIPHPVAATVTVGKPTEDGNRPMTLSFTQPPALEGVTVSVAPGSVSDGTSGGGGRTVTFTAASPHGTVTSTAEGGELDGFLRFAEVLLPHGDVVAVSPVGEDGTHTVTCKTAEGDWEAEFLFSREGELPLRVRAWTERETIDLTVTEDGLAP